MKGSEKMLVQRVLELTLLSRESKVLELFCGEGDYLFTMKQSTGASVFGVDASTEELILAKRKDPELNLVLGTIGGIPFKRDCLDFVYMIDPLPPMKEWQFGLEGIREVLRDGGEICIVTRSDGQAEEELLVKYFPSLSKGKKRRYASIYRLSQLVKESGFRSLESQVWEGEIVSGLSFLRDVENKTYPELSEIPQREYEKGLERLTSELGPGSLFRVSRYTLIRARK
jgi:ubiquinone/menaquinone biosynthesis C-methylase UbiE